MANPEFYRELDSVILLPWLVAEGPRYIGATFWIYILIVLIALFAINTSVCTFDRLYSIIKMKKTLGNLFCRRSCTRGFGSPLRASYGSVSGFALTGTLS